MTLEILLDEAETLGVNIKLAEMDDLNDGLGPFALECCRQIRTAQRNVDVSTAAHFAIRLGERLAELRKIGELARSSLSRKSRQDCATDARVEAFNAARARGVPATKAYKQVAEQFGLSVRTIMRAVR